MKPGRLTRAIAGCLLCLAWFPARPSAHDLSTCYLDVTPGDGTVVIRYRLPAAEMDLLFGLDANLDGRYSHEELQGKLPSLKQYVDRRLTIRIDERVVHFDPQAFELWGDEQDHLFVDFTTTLPTGVRPARIQFESRLFQDLVPRHKTLVAVQAGDAAGQYALDATNPSATWQGRPVGSVEHVGRFLVLGIEHIFTGYDHVLFLFGLLLRGGAMLDVVKIVTSFTVAHSLTMALAVLGHVQPNTTMIEAGIAFSIAYVGLEDLLNKELTRRWHVTFLFGLVHGFGFANILRDMNLSSGQLARSLFSFNLGVEVGQVAIVALVLPVLMAMRRLSWHHVFVKGASTTVLVFGVFWLVERLFGG